MKSTECFSVKAAVSSTESLSLMQGKKKKKRLFWENLDNIIMKNKVTYQTLVTSCYLSDS